MEIINTLDTGDITYNDITYNWFLIINDLTKYIKTCT